MLMGINNFQNEDLFPFLGFILFIGLIWYCLDKFGYMFEPQPSEEDNEMLAEYRTSVVNDVINHIAFWLNVNADEIKIEYDRSPEYNTIARLYFDLYEIKLYFHWDKRYVDVQLNYYINTEGCYETKSKRFKFKDDFVNNDDLCIFITIFLQQVYDAIGTDYESMLHDIMSVSKQLADSDLTDDEVRNMLFMAATEFSSRLDPEMMTKDKKYFAASSRLMAYIIRHYFKEYIEYVKQASKAQENMFLGDAEESENKTGENK